MLRVFGGEVGEYPLVIIKYPCARVRVESVRGWRYFPDRSAQRRAEICVEKRRSERRFDDVYLHGASRARNLQSNVRTTSIANARGIKPLRLPSLQLLVSVE